MTSPPPSDDRRREAIRSEPPEHSSAARPSRVRYEVVAISMAMAFCLYLDRVCLGEIVKSDLFLGDTRLSKEQVGGLLGAFFLTYALCQVPAGWIGDRFGTRRMLTFYILAWSLLTALSGWASTYFALLVARWGVGIAQAGAYPASSGALRRWIEFPKRGRASAAVALGGRLGATLAPVLTAQLILLLADWRQVLMLYGLAGVAVAAVYWTVVRDRPELHPRCNDGERVAIGSNADPGRPSLRELGTVVRACASSRSLWLNSLEQFCVNIGWAFLVTWLPTYLKESRGISAQTGAMMVTGVLAMGMVGQILGGWATDACAQWFGLRWGRVLPISCACCVASLAYIGCLTFESTWAIVACCGVVSMMTDVANPPVWAFMQDVGGRATGSVYGWANMWGNLGASVSAVMVPWLMKQGEAGGQATVFLACAASFLVAAIAALGMDATRPIATDATRPNRTDPTRGA